MESSPLRDGEIPSASTYSSGIPLGTLNRRGGAQVGSVTGPRSPCGLAYGLLVKGKSCALQYHFGGKVSSLVRTSKQALRAEIVLTIAYTGLSTRGGVLGEISVEASGSLGRSASKGISCSRVFDIAGNVKNSRNERVQI